MTTWTNLASFKRPSILLKLNTNELVVASTINAKDRNKGIYKYDGDKDEWMLWIKYPENFKRVKNSSFAIDRVQNILCLLTRDTLWTVDIKTKTWSKLNCNDDINSVKNPCCIIINSKYHIIGGSKNDQHKIIDITQNRKN